MVGKIGYVVVENAGYVGERDVHGPADRRDCETWMGRQYGPEEVEALHVEIAYDGPDGRTYEI